MSHSLITSIFVNVYDRYTLVNITCSGQGWWFEIDKVWDLLSRAGEQAIMNNLSVKNLQLRGFPVAQWWRIHLPMQETRIQPLVWEDSTCCGHLSQWVTAIEPVCALEPGNGNYRAHVSTPTEPCGPRAVFCNKRSMPVRRLRHHREEQPPLVATREKPA